MNEEITEEKKQDETEAEKPEELEVKKDAKKFIDGLLERINKIEEVINANQIEMQKIWDKQQGLQRDFAVLVDKK